MSLSVLFVRSGNKGQHPITQNQGDSLSEVGCKMFYFDVIGRGWSGYFRNISLLRKRIKEVQPDVIHAHYSLCGILATLCFLRIPIVVSLMGSDVLTSSRSYRLLLKILSRVSWRLTIVKSQEMYDQLKVKRAVIIPNGVNGDDFFKMDRAEARRLLGWPLDVKVALFASDPERPEKNYGLFKESMTILISRGEELIEKHLCHLNKKEMMLSYNAADLLVLTSHHEGSPNVIKEAMFCHCPFVSVDVGDVQQWIRLTSGNTLITPDAMVLADTIQKYLNHEPVLNNQKAFDILDSKRIALQLKEHYIRLKG